MPQVGAREEIVALKGLLELALPSALLLCGRMHTGCR